MPSFNHQIMDSEPVLTVSFTIRALAFLLKAFDLFEGIFTKEDIPLLKSLYEIQPLDESIRGYIHSNITEMYGCDLKREVRQKLKHNEPLEQFNQVQNECLKSLIRGSGLIMPSKDRAIQAVREYLENGKVYLRNPLNYKNNETISFEWYIFHMISYYDIAIYMLSEKDNYTMVIEDDLPQKYIDFTKEKGIPLISEPWINKFGLFCYCESEMFYHLAWGGYGDELEKIL